MCVPDVEAATLIFIDITSHLIFIGKALFRTATPLIKSQGSKHNSKVKAMLCRIAAEAGDLLYLGKKDVLGWHLLRLQEDKRLLHTMMKNELVSTLASDTCASWNRTGWKQ